MSITVHMTEADADMIGRGLRLLMDAEGHDHHLVLLAYMFRGATEDEARAVIERAKPEPLEGDAA